MPIETDEDGRDDNEGPHCRNCHIGANNCYVCHSNDNPNVVFGTGSNVSAAYTATITAQVSNMSNYASQAFIRQSAVTGGVGDPCLDGGFSFPHRTLGANMLKDELYGVDFDGSVVAFGEQRTANVAGGMAAGTVSADQNFEYWVAEDRNATSIIPSVEGDSGVLEGAEVENLDSVCIDCHGDASYWNGDDSTFYTTGAADTAYTGIYGSGQKGGWELLLKGLP